VQPEFGERTKIMLNAEALRRMRRAAWLGVAVMAVAVVGALLWRVTTPDGMPEATYSGEADIRSDFSLVDHAGRRVTEADYADRWHLVFFGFTSCPDICPTTLAYMADVLDLLGEDAERVAPLFVTVDPARDTVPVLADYVGAFHPRLIGLTGTEEEIAAAMEAFKVYAERIDDPVAPDGYSMAHSGYIYLMTPEGRFVDVYQERDQPPEALAEAILQQMEDA
jgi:protein SCO1/2